ncbi:hypothetical protein J2Y63_002422 [Shinella sp. BE166]|uniref:hypothetical protein n=1 Tax=Shinella sp. BE166 TaxID=3373918 RepID=UPI003EBAF115
MRQEPEGFPAFWEIWRKHARHTDGRGLARETFAKHVKAGAEPQDIVDGATYFFRTIKERDREFVPLSSTWLNRGAYEDLAVSERQYQQRVSEAMARRQQETNVVQIDPAKRAEMAERARVLLKVGVGA